MNGKPLQDWVGNSRTVEDHVDLRQARLMACTMDSSYAPGLGGALPPLWHWIYFHEAVPMREVGRDGHARLGGFLPPVELPRRMYAGGRFTFHAPLEIGTSAMRTSTVTSVEEKTGRSGQMCLVTVRHEVAANGQLRLSEEQDIVYLQPRPPGAPSRPLRPAPAEAQFSRTVTPTPTWLFRYSALTFNGHRIHYDADFCRDVEGYPGLVVHGPLLATLLAGLAEQNAGGQRLATFAFRAVSPVFHPDAFSIAGRVEAGGGTAWALAADGGLAMLADFTYG